MLALPVALQHVVIGLAVTLSLWVVMNQQLPGTLRKVRMTIAKQLLCSRFPAIRGVGKRLAPQVTRGRACGGCNGCGSPPGNVENPEPEVQGQLRPQ